MCRYNQAHGGNNRYKALDGVAPAWTSTNGWKGDGSTTYLKTGIVPSGLNWTMFVRASGLVYNGLWTLCGILNTNQNSYFAIYHMYWNLKYSYGSVDTSPGTSTSSGVVCLSPSGGYLNGKLDSAYAGTSFNNIQAYDVYLLASNSSNAPNQVSNAYIQSVAIYNRTLPPAEIFDVSQQMRYCDVNPDWSAWTPKHRWFYAPAEPAGNYDESISLARVSSVDLSGCPTMGENITLGRSLAADMISGMAVEGALTLSNLRGANTAASVTLSDTISLARQAGISETALQVFFGAIELSKQAGIDAASLMSMAAAIMLGYQETITETGAVDTSEELILDRFANLSTGATLALFEGITLEEFYELFLYELALSASQPGCAIVTDAGVWIVIGNDSAVFYISVADSGGCNGC